MKITKQYDLINTKIEELKDIRKDIDLQIELFTDALELISLKENLGSYLKTIKKDPS